MKRDELYNLIARFTEYDNVDIIMTAVEAYCSASNKGNAPVGGSLPPVTLDDVAKKLGYRDTQHCELNMENNPDYNKWWGVIKEIVTGGNDR